MRPTKSLSRRLSALLAIGVVTVALAGCAPSTSPTDATESLPAESAPAESAPASESPAS